MYRCRNKIELYTQNKITYTDLVGENLRGVQAVQVADKEVICPDILQNFIAEIEYPINFLDFETFQNAVPRFDKERPYQQLPFQYSLHILEKNGELRHYEFLASCDR